MRAFISAGFLSLFVSGLPCFAADAPSSDSAIQQRLVGTWCYNIKELGSSSTTTIGTNGDFVEVNVTDPNFLTRGESRTNRLEGTVEIKDGLTIFTFKSVSFTNQPVHVMFTNVVIRVTDNEWVCHDLGRSDPIILKRVTR